MVNLEIKPSNAKLLTEFYGSVPKTQRSYCVIRDGEVIAVAGVHIDHGRLVMFSDSKEKNKKEHKFLIVRLARKVLGLAKDSGLPVHAYAEDGCSAKFLEYLGFKEYEGVHIWHN